jgi:hypothetical protein
LLRQKSKPLTIVQHAHYPSACAFHSNLRLSLILSVATLPALLLFSFCSMPNSRIMIHQPLGGASGQAVDIEIQAKEIMYHKVMDRVQAVDCRHRHRHGGRTGCRDPWWWFLAALCDALRLPLVTQTSLWCLNKAMSWPHSYLAAYLTRAVECVMLLSTGQP